MNLELNHVVIPHPAHELWRITYISVLPTFWFTLVNSYVRYDEDTREYSADFLTKLPDIQARATEVKIWSNTLTSIPANSFSHLKACQKIKIWLSYITVIKSGAFNGMDSLLVFKMWSCNPWSPVHFLHFLT